MRGRLRARNTLTWSVPLLEVVALVGVVKDAEDVVAASDLDIVVTKEGFAAL
jgi:hypothetical protein